MFLIVNCATHKKFVLHPNMKLYYLNECVLCVRVYAFWDNVVLIYASENVALT